MEPGDRTGFHGVNLPGLDYVQHSSASNGYGQKRGHRIDCTPRRALGRLECEGCAGIWARDRLITILHPLNEYHGRVGMITITAPGSDLLPWQQHPEDVHEDECSGRHGCVVEKEARDRWNASVSWRRSRMHQAMQNQLRLKGPVILVRAWEPQKRLLAHCHEIVPVEYLGPMVRWLKANAAGYGFGFIDDGRNSRRGIKPGATAAQAGAYLGSYIGKKGKVAGVLEAVQEGVIPERTFHVGPQVSRGFTMRFLRLKRRAWAVMNQGALVPMWVTAIEWGRALEAIGAASSNRDPPMVAVPG